MLLEKLNEEEFGGRSAEESFLLSGGEDGDTF
jgi:hypothetical protein